MEDCNGLQHSTSTNVVVGESLKLRLKSQRNNIELASQK